MLWAILARIGVSGWIRVLALALFVLNPYTVGLSVFVFTDMAALLGLAIAVHGVTAQRPMQTSAGIALATLSRQYLAFLAPALILTALSDRSMGTGDRIRWVVATGIGMAPLALLVWLWNGQLAPANAIREVYLSEGLRFDPHALSLYLAAPGAYLLPLLAIVAYHRTSLKATVGAMFAASWCFAIPVQPSLAQTREGVSTVGFVHRALTTALPPAAVDIAWYLLSVLWLAGIFGALTRRELRQDTRQATVVRFLWFSLAAFLVVMPFSYMPWEKYALPMLMIAILILAGHSQSVLRMSPHGGE
jgi:hypothetical protein